MPRYEYACSVCGHREDKVVPVADRDEPQSCPTCSEGFCDSWTMGRDAIASMKPHTELEYNTPIYSNAAGIAPAQIPDALRRFPHHEYTPDGRMVFRSHSARVRALKEIGLIDKN